MPPSRHVFVHTIEQLFDLGMSTTKTIVASMDDDTPIMTAPIQLNVSPNDSHFMKMMKLGVALSVIRSKPLNRSVRDHAKHMLSLYKMSQHRWQEKCDKAEAEILSLRQQLILSNSSYASQVSGDESASDSQSLFPTPPSSSETTAAPPPPPPSTTVLKDIMFLQSMVNLQRAGASAQSQSSDANTIMLSDITQATLEHSLRCVRDAVSDPSRPLTSSMLCQAVSSTVRVLEHLPPDHWTRRCQRTLQEIMSLLVQRFLVMDRFEQCLTTCRLLDLMPSFYQMRSLSLLQGTLEVFAQQLQDFCSHLRQTRQSDLRFCPLLAENMFDVLSALESCVSHNGTILSTKDGQVVGSRLQEHLETCLLHLTQVYPLVAHCVWRITNLLELCLTQQH